MGDTGTNNLADFISAGRGQFAAFFQRIPIDQANRNPDAHRSPAPVVSTAQPSPTGST